MSISIRPLIEMLTERKPKSDQQKGYEQERVAESWNRTMWNGALSRLEKAGLKVKSHERPVTGEGGGAVVVSVESEDQKTKALKALNKVAGEELKKGRPRLRKKDTYAVTKMFPWVHGKIVCEMAFTVDEKPKEGGTGRVSFDLEFKKGKVESTRMSAMYDLLGE
jgi:hypothetical protein